MDTTVSRRKLLAATGVGLGLATAGCAGAGSERSATAFLQLSEEAQTELNEENQRLRQELQSGNLTRQEAGQQFSELESDLNDELLETARSEAEGLGLTVDDSIAPSRGSPLLLISGPEGALLDFMEQDIVAGLTGADQFEEIQQQQEPQANQTAS
ncbi:hypothetical protein EGH24_04895 [Halonotius terrestris]|uniref:Uncharacterized protein n=1 Tax=Halonotius terrestris TaxID=2487750 RepID=A0A8J8PAG7_9EURY|nr:hypothetical protein [Halonotius terrestris]TQQ82780.1 hypothetical protein EGH24_04895 [Halonotius terrestris]